VFPHFVCYLARLGDKGRKKNTDVRNEGFEKGEKGVRKRKRATYLQDTYNGAGEAKKTINFALSYGRWNET